VPVGIEPTTEGLWGGSKRSEWSGGDGLVYGIEDVGRAETQFDTLVSLRVLVQQEAQVRCWFVGSTDGQ